MIMTMMCCPSSSQSYSTASEINQKISDGRNPSLKTSSCPSCGHHLHFQEQAGIHDLPGLPAGVKFDPSDQEILEHLEGKVRSDVRKRHPLIDEFIPTIGGDSGICYTHPEKLPGVNKDGLVRHFFHRPSMAYTNGTRKRRKVSADNEDGSETRWHKTGKTRPVYVDGEVKGHKKILVLYISYGKQRKKSEKTNWVMHQYHLGSDEEEQEGELVVSVFYQTQPRSHSNISSSVVVKESIHPAANPEGGLHIVYNQGIVGSDNLSVASYDRRNGANAAHILTEFAIHTDGHSYIHD